MVGYKKKYIKLDTNETIAYIESLKSKSKRQLVLIHGNFSESRSFYPLIDELKNEYEIYALDLRGLGDSSYNNPARTVRAYSKDVVDFFYKKNIDNALIIGWSFGGGVALEAAADLGKRVRGIILLSSISPDGYKFDFLKPLKYQNYMRALFPFTMSFFERFNIFQEIKNFISSREEIKHYFMELLFNVKNPEKEYLDLCVDAALKQRNNIDVAEALITFNMSKERTNFKGTRRISYIKCPIIQFHGEKDLVIPYLEAIHATKLLGKNAVRINFKESGHAILIDESEKLFREIRKFSNRVFLAKEALCLEDQEMIG